MTTIILNEMLSTGYQITIFENVKGEIVCTADNVPQKTLTSNPASGEIFFLELGKHFSSVGKTVLESLMDLHKNIFGINIIKS